MNVTSMSESEFMCDGHRSVTCGTTASASDIIEAYGLRGRNFPILCDYGQWKVVAVNAADTALIDINGSSECVSPWERQAQNKRSLLDRS
jgi:hypothetical protein